MKLVEEADEKHKYDKERERVVKNYQCRTKGTTRTEKDNSMIIAF